MKKILIVLFLLICFSIFWGQSVELKWTNAPESLHRFDGDTEKFPVLLHPGYALKDGIPHLTINLESPKVSLGNLEWEKIPTSYLGDVPKEFLPTKDEFEIKSVKAREKLSSSFEIVPLKRINNEVFRLKRINFTTQQTLGESGSPQAYLSFGDSPLKTGNWFKIRIPRTGIYRLNRSFFTSNGININGVNPKNIAIYGNGGEMLPEKIDDFRYENLMENAILFVGEDDNSFDANDYILFYAQGPDSWDRSLNPAFPPHKKNIYEDFAYYYIHIKSSPAKRITTATTTTPTTFFTTFDDYQFFEEETANINSLGRVWVGKALHAEPQQNITFEFDNIDPSFPVRTSASIFTSGSQNNTLEFKLNGNDLPSSTIPLNVHFFQVLYTQNFTLPSTTNSLNYQITFNNSANPLGRAWFDYLEVYCKRQLAYNGKTLFFRQSQNLEDGNVYGFRISGVNASVRVWNISDRVNVKQMQNLASGNIFEFGYQSTDTHFKNEFVAFEDAQALTPQFVGRVQNQNIRGLSGVEYFIITHRNFINDAERLATYHNTFRNTKVVTVQQIYEEFSSGSQDVTAIRDFLRYHYYKDNKVLKFALLFGAASYDFKNRISGNTNFVPAYQSENSVSLQTSFVSDDFYAILDDGETELTSSQLDLAIGRLPCRNLSEARSMVNKTLAYVNALPGQSSPFGDWRLNFHLVVDDDPVSAFSPSPTFHSVMESTVANFVQTQRPIYTLRKLYADAFEQVVTAGGQRFPQVNTAIKNAIETGTLIINYFGHGGFNGWAQERILTNDDIRNNGNINNEFTRLPFIVTITCDFTIWDNPLLDSGGEIVLRNPNGGAFGLLTTSRAIGVSYGISVNEIFIKELMTIQGDSYQPLGEAVRKAKVSFSTFDNRRVNLLADPAISLSRPKRNINITTINGIPAASFTGTWRALDFVTFEGEVLNASNTIDTSFNGIASVALFDKVVIRQTLNNDGNLAILSYPEQVNLIYRGNTTVTNGYFKFQFYIPRNINFTIGDGKLLVYAHNNQWDAATFRNISVGGINPNGLNDNTPPKVGLYMNNTNFVNGGITNRNPYLLACIVDDTGINSSGAGVGQDITAVLDNDVLNTIVLNDYFNGGENPPCSAPDAEDYQKGRVVYPLRNLSLGPHQIRFKVWDINNNSTTETLDFIVLENGNQGLVIKRLLNWPNPFTNKTFFHFEHNCDSPLQVQVQIFTISGKLVKTINTQVSSAPFREGYRTHKYDIAWDGKDDFGDAIGKGVYVYRLTAQALSDDENCKGTATAIEKLVILK